MTTLSFTDEKVINDAGGIWLCLKVTDAAAARRFCLQQEEKHALMDADIKRHRERRSLDANAYFWVLAGKLAAATGISPEEVYRHAVRGVGGNYDTVCVQKKAAESLKRSWSSNGLGWQWEEFPSKIEGCVNLNLYYGSSLYDTRQMSRLIDNIVQDCKAVGIETLTPQELDAMMEEWGRG